MKTKLQHTLLASCCAHVIVLAACGGGGGGGSIVRGEAPPPPPPPPVLCPPPITADCVVTGPANSLLRMDGGRQSDHALIVRFTEGALNLVDGTYRFSSGSVVEFGSLYVNGLSSLQSNVTVQAPALLGVVGTVIGSTTNHGKMELWGTVTGDVANHGKLEVGSTIYGQAQFKNTIEGDFRQTANGAMITTIPAGIPAGDFFGLLQISGRADLDGTLQLQQYSDDWGPYPLPTTPLTAHVLHAGGGVFGQFAQWTSPGLFVEGSVRYGSNDVWFDLTRISVQAAMAANAVADAMTLASAGNVDAALTSADGFALTSPALLGDAQRRFLASASSLLYARDVARATRSLDSLSGHAHALAQDVLQEQTAATIAQLDARLDRLPRGHLQGGAWSAPLAHHGRLGGSYSVDGQTSGFDRWLGPHWLMGGSVGTAQSQMQFDRMGGYASGTTSLGGVYAHYRNDQAHATMLAGTSRALLNTRRPIDLGDAGEHQVFARRALSQAFVHGEVGRRVPIGSGQWTPYVAVDYAALRSGGFVEQGDTGFELAAQPAHNGQLSMAFGGRYAHEWNVGGGRLGLTLDARYQRRLATHGDALQAAFAGVPDASFDLEAWPPALQVGMLGVGLTGDLDTGWTWAMDYRGRFGNQSRDTNWSITLRRPF